MRYTFACVGLLALSAASAATAGAQSLVIDFASFRSDTTAEYQATPGGDVIVQGFEFSAAFGTGARNALGTWGTDPNEPVGPENLPTNLGPTAAALWATQFDERIDLSRTDGRQFNLYSMDVAHQYNRSYLLSGDLSPFTLVFFGFQTPTGSNTLAASFSIPAPPIVGGVQAPVLTRLLFPDSWRSLYSVAWFQRSGSGTTAVAGSAVSHQFTNVNVEVIPEPGTTALLVVGAGGLALAARRRRVTAA